MGIYHTSSDEGVLQLLPKEYHSTDFFAAMVSAQERDPARTYWVDQPCLHPFYTLGLDKIYSSQYSIPWRPVFDPATGPMDPDFATLAGLNPAMGNSTSLFQVSASSQTRMCLGLEYFADLRTRIHKEYPGCSVPSFSSVKSSTTSTSANSSGDLVVSSYDAAYLDLD